MVFSIKYRMKLLRDSDRINYVKPTNYVKPICSEIGEIYWFDFDAIGKDGDYAHIFVVAAQRYPLSKVMQIIKSISAKEFFKQFPEIRKQPWGGNFGVM
jgi:putative transposase